MRYIIYGAGAIGGTLGACLFEGGCDVMLIARGEHGRAIAGGGLRFGTADGWRTLPIPVVDHPAKLAFTRDDVVVLAMKSQDTDDALAALEPLTFAETHIVCAQNGVENERRTLRRFANTHGMCVKAAGVHLEPGVVHLHNPPFTASCDVGRVPAGHDGVDDALARDLEAARIRSTACDDIMARKYSKLVSNLTNVLEAAGGRAALASPLAELARDEAAAALAAAGIVASQKPADATATMRFVDVPGVARPGGSTMQSLIRGGHSLEVDDLNGEIVLLGRLHGVPTPVNVRLQALGKRLVEESIPAGSLSLDDLERA